LWCLGAPDDDSLIRQIGVRALQLIRIVRRGGQNSRPRIPSHACSSWTQLLYFVRSRGLDLLVRASFRSDGTLLLTSQPAVREYAEHCHDSQDDQTSGAPADAWRLLWLRAQIYTAGRDRFANGFRHRLSIPFCIGRLILGGHG
jgi:hypothetical protein